MKKEISEEAKKTAKHIGIISEGAIQTLIEEIRQQERDRIIEIIEKLKEETRKETGAYKYDFAYDDIIKTLNQ